MTTHPFKYYIWYIFYVRPILKTNYLLVFNLLVIPIICGVFIFVDSDSICKPWIQIKYSTKFKFAVGLYIKFFKTTIIGIHNNWTLQKIWIHSILITYKFILKWRFVFVIIFSFWFVFFILGVCPSISFIISTFGIDSAVRVIGVVRMVTMIVIKRVEVIISWRVRGTIYLQWHEICWIII